jgi:hypothetical protein
MCDNCKHVLKGYKIKHDISSCPLFQLSYCGICAKRGHFTLECPDDEVLEFRQATFMEQLIPPSLLDAYKIETQTPLLSRQEPRQLHEPVLEVSRKAEAVRSILFAYNRPCKTNGREAAEENEAQLEKLAHELKRKLVYRVDETTNKKKSRTFKVTAQ